MIRHLKVTMLNQFEIAHFYIENIVYLFWKTRYLKRRSIVLGLSLEKGFLEYIGEAIFNFTLIFLGNYKTKQLSWTVSLFKKS